MRSTAKAAALALLIPVALACGSSGGDTSSGSTAAATTTAGSPSPGAGSTAAATKVSANTATTAQLVAALTAAGVTNPNRWAGEIEEYRPYDKGDANLTKLRQNLQKYNPGTDTMNKIISALEP